MGIIGFAMAVPLLFIGGFDAAVSLLAGIVSVIIGIVLVLYFAITEAASGASIGKHILGLRVRMTAGKLRNFAEAIVRNISKIHWVWLLIDMVIGLATSKSIPRSSATGSWEQRWSQSKNRSRVEDAETGVP